MTSLRPVSSLACMFVLALGCNPTVVEAPDDDVGEDTTSDADSSTDDSSSTGETEATSESSTDDTDDATSGDDPACTPGTLDCSCDGGECADGLVCIEDVCTVEDSPTTDDTTDTGEEKHVCGWLVRKEYYFCGAMGEDPSMEHPISCEGIGFAMVPGTACNGKLDYVGCCDVNGDAWYCLEGFIEYEVCGAG